MTSEHTAENDARCPWCPPRCRSCVGDRDCECYSHQDWPDTHVELDLAPRLARCIDAPGCDGRSHGIECNNALYTGAIPPAKTDGAA